MWPDYLMIFFCVGVLAYIAAWDYRAFRIPDHATAPLAVVGALRLAFVMPEAIWPHLVAAAVSGVGLYGIGWLYHRLRGIEALGLGDVKLIVAGALWIGPGIAMALAIGAGVALVISVAGMALGRQSRTDPIPLGLYLSLGIGSVLLTG